MVGQEWEGYVAAGVKQHKMLQEGLQGAILAPILTPRQAHGQEHTESYPLTKNYIPSKSAGRMSLGSPLTLDTNDQWIEGGEQAATRLLDPIIAGLLQAAVAQEDGQRCATQETGIFGSYRCNNISYRSKWVTLLGVCIPVCFDLHTQRVKGALLLQYSTDFHGQLRSQVRLLKPLLSDCNTDRQHSLKTSHPPPEDRWS